jgi:hypothetical protein
MTDKQHAWRFQDAIELAPYENEFFFLRVYDDPASKQGNRKKDHAKYKRQ